MKSPLLRMLEWRERAVNGWDFDTWHSGSFIEHWAEPQILNELSNVFTRYEEESLKKAVMAMIDLFRSVSLETAKHLQLSYPTAIDEHMTKLIKTYLSESV